MVDVCDLIASGLALTLRIWVPEGLSGQCYRLLHGPDVVSGSLKVLLLLGCHYVWSVLGQHRMENLVVVDLVVVDLVVVDLVLVVVDLVLVVEEWPG